MSHIAIIPDGNRRWAKKNGLRSFFGHRKGAETMEKIIKAAFNADISALTVWGCSIGNLTKRPPEELKFLFELFGEYFNRLCENEEIYEREIRTRVLGRWEEFFPEFVKKPMRKIIENTESHSNYSLTFLMAYSGKEEMAAAINKIAELKNKNPEMKIDGDSIKSNLWTKDLPPVDLAIRTGESPSDRMAHWSEGFMMWDAADSQFYFTDTLWPDFSEEEFGRAVEIFAKKERKFGK